MRILQLTDTHLYGTPSARHYDRIDTTAALRAVLDRLSDLEDVDLVLHTGDASDDGTPVSYRLLHELLEPFAAGLGAPLAVTMGNHDVPASYAEVAGPGGHGGPWQDHVREIDGQARVVVLDSSVPDAGYGHLDPEQLDWLREVLSRPGPGIGTVLAVHHPPLLAPTALLRGLDLDGLDEFADVLAGSDVRVILSGHYHHEESGGFAGIPVHVAPGVTNVVDPVAPADAERALAMSGASLVEVSPAGGGTGDAGAADSRATVTPVGPGNTTTTPGSILPAQVSVRTWSSTWPNAGDTSADVTRPVYEFGSETVARILAASGRPA
jgi:Icc protein